MANLPDLTSPLRRLVSLLGSEHVEPREIYTLLRALQDLGLTRTDLEIHLERARAVNDATSHDDEFEDYALLALDMVDGRVAPRFALRWDAAELARINIHEAVTLDEVRSGLQYAVMPIDLLPPRPTDQAHKELLSRLEAFYESRWANNALTPTRAFFVAVPKGPFASRPAALLTVQDRMTYEGIASRIEPELETLLAPEVSWPRRRDVGERHREDDTKKPLEWRSEYVVKGDIASFYEQVDHALLASTLQREAGLPHRAAATVQHFLGAVMGSAAGLPQGPAASDILATLFLKPLDDLVKKREVTFTRYADDYFFPADSIDEGRRILRDLSNDAASIGLSLNASKSQVMRRSTYERGFAVAGVINDIKERLRSSREESLLQDDEEAVAEALEAIGIDEETLWDVFYHENITLDSVITSVRDRITPTTADAYGIYLQELANSLRSDAPPDNLSSAERLARECLLYVSAREVSASVADLRTMLEWFPRLAPNVATYLRTTAQDSPELSRKFIEDWINESREDDWTTAWLCHVAEARSVVVEGRFVDVLRSLVADTTRGFLTRSTAARALSLVGELRTDEWQQLFDEAPAPMRAELVFGAWADRSADALAVRKPSWPELLAQYGLLDS